MANKVLIQQNSVVQPYPAQNFPGSDSIRIVQFNPQVGQGFSGSVVIEGSFAAQPGNNDFNQILSATFTGHTNNLTLEVQSNAPTIRARIVTSTQGAIAVFADSADRSIQGSQGANPATVLVDSPNRVAGTGQTFKINSVVVPSITSDDVIYANDFGLTVTDLLDGTNGATGKQDKIGNGVITADETDVNLLTGMATYGLTGADLQKLADVNATAAELNRTIGATSDLQSQINALSLSIPASLSGITTSAATIDGFFDAASVVSISDLNQLDGLTASSADLNALTGSVGTFNAVDLAKLGDITASAVEINALTGFTGNSTDLNGIVGLTTSSADLNAITGLAGTGVTATQLGFLNGLTQNVQAALASLPSLAGLTASVNDLNVLTGIFSGSSGYPAPVTVTEIGYLNGLVGNIQNQLNNKRDIGVAIGVAEISGASITTTELNYLQGATSNIQAQIDAISTGAITPSGGTFTGPIYIANGSAANPGLGYTTPNNTTGFYLFGANGIGLSVAASRFMSLDGTDVVIGNGVTNGSPTLKGVGMSVSDPAYAFNNDEDSGMYWAGVDAVGISAGAEAMAVFDAANDQITLGGTPANNNAVEVTGVFAGEKVLGRATIQAGAVSGATGQTPLYTVGAGRSAIVTKVMVRLTNVTNFTSGALFRMNVGFGAAFDEIVDNTNNTTVFNPGTYAFDTPNQVMPLGTGSNTFPAISGSNGADYQTLNAGTVLQADVTAVAGADDYDMELIVFGHEYV